MIIVEIRSPMLGKSYDFQVKEDTPLCDVRDEITEMICRKEQCRMSVDECQPLLWDAQSGRRLPLDRTVYENGLITGSTLLLI